MVVDKTAEREEKLRALQEKLTSSVEQLVTGEDWKRAIEFAARFRGRSFSNSLLIAVAHAEAHEKGLVAAPYPTYVAGYKQWQQLGRQVRKGMPGYQILAPVVAKFASSNPADPDSWHRVRRGENAAPGEVTRTRMVGFRPAYVWDISGTDGHPVPERPMPVLLEGQAPPGVREGLVAEIEARDFTVVEVPSAAEIHGANGLTDFASKTVSYRADVDDSSQVRTLGHELGHLLMHDPANGDWVEHRGIGEVEAESFALMIASTHQMDSSDYTIPYVASWAASVPGKTPVEVVQATADKVCETAGQVLARLDTAQIGNGIPDALAGAEHEIAEERKPVGLDRARSAGAMPTEGRAGGRDENGAAGWRPGEIARLVDIGTGMRETVTVAALHTDDTVTVAASDGRTGCVPLGRLAPVGAYEPESRPLSVTEESWRRALDELGVTCDRLEERVSPLDPQRWRDLAYRVARQLDDGNPVYVTSAGGDESGLRVIGPDPQQPRPMNPWSTNVGDRFLRDGQLWEAVRITPASAKGTSRLDGPTIHAKIVRGDGTLSDFTADIWSKSMSHPASAYTRVEETTDLGQSPTTYGDALPGLEVMSMTAQARDRLGHAQHRGPVQGASAARRDATPPATGMGV